MPDPDKMIVAVHRYVEAFDKSDAEMAADIFANDATVEDPIGSPLKEGREAILDFYTGAMASGAKLILQEPVRVGADHAAFAFQVQMEMNGNAMTIDVIDTFRFDDNGKVTQMKAFWGPGNMKTG